MERGDLDGGRQAVEESATQRDRWSALSRAFHRVNGSWGNTLRFALTVVVVGLVLRMVADRIPWDLVLQLLRRGA
jgi:hypothetical protein